MRYMAPAESGRNGAHPVRKQRRVIVVWPGGDDIPADGVLDTGFERQDLSTAALGTDDMDAVTGAVDILHPKPSNFSRPQPIDGEQSQNRGVSPLQRRVAVSLSD